MSDDLLMASLNEAQQQAVTSNNGNTLIVAGAGSGKTRVLVHRCAWLMQAQHLSPMQILAVTFTNKAALEMRQRIEALQEYPLHGMWCGTFHGLCHRFLRTHFQEANLPEDFHILDQDDQFKLIKNIQKDMCLDDSQWPIKKTQSMINHFKEQGQRSHHLNTETQHLSTMVEIYSSYEKQCQKAGWVDFAELLLSTVECLEKYPDVQRHYHDRFRHILIDEFQDTNALQYRWIKAMSGPACYLTAVGDDDQSIYSWRGAKVDHLMKFSHEFPDVTTIRLEQNYRSTATILKAANQVISNNEKRLGKTLWTQGETGENIACYNAYNEFDEAQYVSQQIALYQQDNIALSEIAILYRSNAQSRLLEEHLTRAHINYRIYGGLRFFERAEIKDAMGYLRLIARRNDDAAFERIVNTPARGIGHATMTQLRQVATEESISLWDAAKTSLQSQALSGRAHRALEQFVHLIEGLDFDSQQASLSDICQRVIEHSGLIEALKNDRSQKNNSKIENLEELVNAMRGYVVSNEKLPPLVDFLANTSLDQGESQQTTTEQSVQLMTLHAAKGLEFPLVFMIGVEEGLFPHKMCINDPQQLEEERRLCYVGMTRAMKKLHLSYAECRRLHGQEHFQRPSRFIAEIPEDLITPVRMRYRQLAPANKPRPHQSVSKTTFKRQQNNHDQTLNLGQRVTHTQFGEGTILNCEGQGAHARVQVVFATHGVKWLMLNQAPLTFK